MAGEIDGFSSFNVRNWAYSLLKGRSVCGPLTVSPPTFLVGRRLDVVTFEMECFGQNHAMAHGF